MATGLFTKVFGLSTLAIMASLSASADTGWQFENARIGHIYTDSLQSNCGGALIGADLVITAAHCVVREDSSDPVMPSDVTFSIPDGKGGALIYPVKDIGLDPKFLRQQTPTREFISRDVALLRLDEFLDGPFDSLASLNPQDEYIALLPATEGDQFLAEPCKASYEKDNVVVLSCARAEGSSGSPAYSLINGERRLVAVVSANGSLNNKPVTFAVGPMGLLDGIQWVSESIAIPTEY